MPFNFLIQFKVYTKNLKIISNDFVEYSFGLKKNIHILIVC